MFPLVPRASMLALALTVAGCAAPAPEPRTYVLVHGAFEDHAIWDDVAEGLWRAGQRVVAVDLPGRDDDHAPPEALTLDGYRDAVAARIDALPGPVVLVGHSFGGITISNVAEQRPARVRSLVYLGALLPKDGDSALSLSRADEANGIGHDSLRISPDRQWGRMLPDDAPARLALFCADCPPTQARRFEHSLIAEPLAPLREAVHLSAERYGQVDKVYLATDADRVISPTAQRAMLAATPVRKVVHLEASHSPFLSRPEAVVRALLQVEE